MTTSTRSAPIRPAPVRPHLMAFDPDSFVRPVYRFVWEPVPAGAAPDLPGAGTAGVATPLSGRRLLVVGAVAQLIEAVAAGLRDLGGDVETASPDREPARGGWDSIIDLNVTGTPYQPGDPGWRPALARTTRMLQHRYPDWAAQPGANSCRYLVVTEQGGLMGYGDAAIAQPLGGVWAGLAKSLLRELPNLAVKVVDFDAVEPAVVARAVAAELSTWDQFEIGYRGGVRHTLEARRREVGPPRLALGADDVVLVSGGARGVGFALARGLATAYGCRVVVTGRADLPVDQTWYLEDEPDYRRRCRDSVAAARSADELRRIRARQRREAELRLIRANLAAVTAAGLAVSYERCDCADQTQVDDLFARIPAPTVIVHNAGIDEPKRLVEKHPDEVVRTVDVKVTGFARLVEAVLATPERRAALRLFCNVGSLAGRLGGMIGQVDYAAGNEALARLGFWARNTHGLPVQTLCWPTWERLGVIANYDAAVRYVSTIAPEDGVRRWLAEIAAAGTDEVMFLGRIGSALVPAMLHGFRRFTGHPDLPRLYSLAHYLGRVEEFVPSVRLRCQVSHQPGAHPCLTDFRVAGTPALPVSVVLEQACAVADWVVPPGWPRLHLVEVRDVAVSIPDLRLTDAGRLVCEATGATTPDGWQVTVRIGTAAGRPVATMILRYGTEPPLITDPPPAAGRPEPAVARPEPAVDAEPTRDRPAGAEPLSWAGLAIGWPEVLVDAAGWWHGRLPVVTAGDLWTVPFPPAAGIAPAAVEAAVQATVERSVAGSDPAWLRIDQLIPCPGAQSVSTLRGSPDRRDWWGAAGDETVLRIHGLTVQRASAR